MHASDRFDDLYNQLAHAWETHQSVRRSQASLPDLAESAMRLHRAQAAMRDWWAGSTLERR
jgi:hypothetical protein